MSTISDPSPPAQRTKVEETEFRRDLLALGWKPGRDLGDALARAYEAQITEVFRTREAALAWARDAA